MPEPKRPNERRTIWIPSELWARVLKAHRAEDRTPAAVIRRLLDKHLPA